MKRLKKTKLILDAVYWIATAVKEVANSGGQLIDIYRKLRKRK